MRNKTTDSRHYGSPVNGAKPARRTSTKKSAQRLNTNQRLHKRYREYLTDLAIYFLELCGFEKWELKLHFCEGAHEDKAAAEIDVLKNYESAAITIYEEPMLGFYENKDGWQLAQIMCHEICHILSQDLKDAAWNASGEAAKEHLNNLCERQTTRTAKTIMSLVPEKVYRI